ncbi:MAG: tripartite tricarboxylate transporter substrate binding protein [Candidatus Protistobacter heckmanni]|nr:tripartite tricarboxylate transporter substrate binding protein [Candidatus Protistobacter heckmanni]
MPKKTLFRRALLRHAALSLAVACGLAALPAQAQDAYPSKPLRIVVPFSPGGGIDILARTIGQRLGDQWKVSVVVDNRPGASGNIGTDIAAKSPPDGYALLMTANTIIMTPSLIKTTPYDAVKDFTPVSMLAIGSLALVTRPNLGIKTAKGLLEYAQANPGKLNYGSPGNGTPHHLAMELLKQRAGVDIVHVPYKGSGGLVSDVIGGQVDVAFLPIHQALPHVKTGKIVMLAAGGARRTAVTPDVPSLEEALNIRDIDVDMWYGLYLPAGAPKPVTAKLNAEVNAILRQPEVGAALTAVGLQPGGSTPEQLAARTGSDLARWAKVVQQAKLSAD